MAEMQRGERSRGRERQNDKSGRFSEVSRDRSPNRGRDRGGMKPSNNRVHVINIPYEFRWQDLKDLFREKVGNVSFVELFVDENDKPKGCGIVEFSDPECVSKAVEILNRFDINGRKIIVKEDTGNSRDRQGNVVGMRNRDFDRGRDDRHGHGGNEFNPGPSIDKWGGKTYGLSPTFLESLGIQVPLCTRVFVANLDYKVDKKKLKEIFCLAGKVINVDLYLDKEGKSRGNAVVEFSHPVESVQAISMFHNQELYDRKLRIYMDRFNEPSRLPEGLKSIGPGLDEGGGPLRDVAFNLPNQNSNQPVAGTTGPASNIPLGLSNTLNSLNASVLLQAANLGGVGNLQSNILGKGVGGTGDVPSLVSYPNIQSHSAPKFAANNFGSNSNFNRNDNFNMPSNNYSSARGKGFESRFDSKPGSMDARNPVGQSNKLLLSNLPPTVTYKMLNDKCGQFGKILRLEDKGNGSVLLTFNNEWEAERAMNNLNRSRIDGRIVDAQYFQ